MRYETWELSPSSRKARKRLEEAGLPSLLCAVLASRGALTLQQARALLRPKDQPMHPPELFADMDRARKRLEQARQAGERTAVYGDYDVDGITSTCLLTDFLRGWGLDVLSYIPDRMEEGYGLNREAAAHLKDQGVSLIVTVDCGITAVDEVEFARELGMDVVVTDHHECKQRIPQAAAVVDPCRTDCPYPFSGLAGVGVALKLALALTPPEERNHILERYLDLAAIGTIADVMPMEGENRAIVARGLEILEHTPRLGLRSLLREVGLEGRPLTTSLVGYTLAPRINAAGRMGRARLALELLLTQDAARGDALAAELCSLNRDRQAVEGDIFQECVQQLDRSPQQEAVLLAGDSWHQGVVGIVASRLSERYSCPAFMICLHEGIGKGSCRSWGGVNLFRLLEGCGDLLEGFGGHALAAGFTVREENIPALTQRLRQAISKARREETFSAAPLVIDAAVRPEELTVENVEALDRLEPCGQGCPRPVLALLGAQVTGLSQVGRGRHLKLRLEAKGSALEAIFFSAAPQELGISLGSRVDAAFSPQINEFRGVRSVQLQLVDLRPALTRAQWERAAFEKYRHGDRLSPAEAQLLLPSRADFADLWRYLERQCLQAPVLEDSAPRIAKGVARKSGHREAQVHVQLCLEIFQERGLISLNSRADQLQISLHRPEHKVDLEASEILRRLRQWAEG